MSEDRMKRCTVCGRKCSNTDDWRAHMFERHPTEFKKYRRKWTFRSHIFPAFVAIPFTLMMLDLNVRRPSIGLGMMPDALLAVTAIGLAFLAGYANLQAKMCEKTVREQALKERGSASRP